MKVVQFVGKACGNVACIVVLVVFGVVARMCEWLAFNVVALMVLLTGADIDQDSLTPHSERSQPWKTSQMHPCCYVQKTAVGNGPDQVCLHDTVMCMRVCACDVAMRSAVQWSHRTVSVVTLGSWHPSHPTLTVPCRTVTILPVTRILPFPGD